MTSFAVDLTALQDVVDRMLAYERTMDTRVSDLDAQAARVCGTWSGSASDEYADAHRAWAGGASSMHAALGLLRSAATVAHGNYSAVCRANLSMWP